MDMHNSMRLYRMELRKNRSYFLIVLTVQLLALICITLVRINQFKNNNSIDLFNIITISKTMMGIAFYSLPLVMIYSWYREEKDNTSYQVLSIPIRSHAILKNKLKAFLSIGLIVSVFSTLVQFILLTRSNRESYTFLRLLYLYFGNFSFLLLILGFACFLIGLLQPVKGQRLLSGLICFLAGSYVIVGVCVKFHTYSYDLIMDIMPGVSRGNYTLANMVHGTSSNVFTLLVASVLTYIGFLLFDKYSEIITVRLKFFRIKTIASAFVSLPHMN